MSDSGGVLVRCLRAHIWPRAGRVKGGDFHREFILGRGVSSTVKGRRRCYFLAVATAVDPLRL